MAGYWIVKGTISDAEAYQAYAKLWGPIAERFGARFIAGGGAHETREGADFERVAIVAFESYEQARACYDDPEYRVALDVAMKAYDPAKPRELVIVEGS